MEKNGLSFGKFQQLSTQADCWLTAPYKLVVIRDVREAILLGYPTGAWIHALNNRGYL